MTWDKNWGNQVGKEMSINQQKTGAAIGGKHTLPPCSIFPPWAKASTIAALNSTTAWELWSGP